jgi:hypothetical protein
MHDIQLLAIFLGANDAVLLDANPRQHVPVDRYGQNIRAMINLIHSKMPAAK